MEDIDASSGDEDLKARATRSCGEPIRLTVGTAQEMLYLHQRRRFDRLKARARFRRDQAEKQFGLGRRA